MKKWLLLAMCLGCCASFTFAEISMEMAGPDSVIVVTTDEMEKALFWDDFIKDDDDDVKKGEDVASEPADSPTKTVKKSTSAKRFLPNVPFISSHAADYATAASIVTADLDEDFDKIKADMLADIRAVNWKTGYNITLRDQSFWKKVKMVLGTCSAMAFSIPDMSEYGVAISQEDVTKGAEKLGDAIECAYYDAKLKRELRYTMEGLYFEIITKKPFLLLTINETIYEALEAKEREILASTGKTENDRLLGILLKNMKNFFDLRANFELMSDDFHNNTGKLYDSSKKGVGDAWSTYKILADHTLRMNTALGQHTLSDKYEESELRGVQKTLEMVGEDAITNQSLVTALRRDPANKALVDLVDTKYKHLRDIKQEVAEKAKNATENDKELLLRAYKKK